jgi:hypothetical protein
MLEVQMEAIDSDPGEPEVDLMWKKKIQLGPVDLD